jgi:hypothetical protein
MDINQRLSDLIQQINRNFEPWNKRKKSDPSIFRTIRLLRKLLQIVSGNNRSSLFEDILTDKCKNTLFGKYKVALRNYASLFNSTTQKRRHWLLKPMKKAKISVSECKLLGFKATYYMYNHCDDSKERDKGGRNSINSVLKRNIELHMETISFVSPYRWLKKQNSNVFVRQTTITEAYDLFKEKFGNSLSFTTFYKNVNEKFKKPYNLTDLCDYCELYREIFNDIVRVSRNFGLLNDNPDHPDLEHLKGEFLKIQESGTDVMSSLKGFDDLDIIQFHKNVAQRQREAYNKMKQDAALLKNHLFIDIDFKQKVPIGVGPRQRSHEFFERTSRSLIGFGIYVVEAGKIKCLNMDVVLNCSSETSFVAITAFKHIRNQDIFKNADKDKYIIWTDCGPHFRSSEFADYLFNELKLAGKSVQLNFFCEQHGKNSRDQHFSVISHYIKCESHVRTIQNSNDVVETIKKRQNFANKAKIEKQIDAALFYAGTLENIEYQCLNTRNDFKCIDHIKNFYNFYLDDKGEIRSHIFSDVEDFSIQVAMDRKETGKRHFDNVEKSVTHDTSIQNLLNKKEFIRSAMPQLDIKSVRNTQASIQEDKPIPTYCNRGK